MKQEKKRGEQPILASNKKKNILPEIKGKPVDAPAKPKTHEGLVAKEEEPAN